MTEKQKERAKTFAVIKNYLEDNYQVSNDLQNSTDYVTPGVVVVICRIFGLSYEDIYLGFGISGATVWKRQDLRKFPKYLQVKISQDVEELSELLQGVKI